MTPLIRRVRELYRLMSDHENNPGADYDAKVKGFGLLFDELVVDFLVQFTEVFKMIRQM